MKSLIRRICLLALGAAIPLTLYAADIKISGLTDGGTIQATDQIMVNRGGATRRVVTGTLTPLGATYITQTANSSLTGEQALSALATGLLKNANGTGVLSIAAAGTDYYAPGSTDVAVADGGSGASTLTGLLQGNGTSAFTAITNSTTVGQTLRVTGSNTYAWGALDLADGDAVTGILPTANGGTNNAFFTVSGPATSAKTFTFPNASATILTTNAPVTVAQGGTGVATLTGIVLANGTSNFAAAASSNVISLWSGTCNSGTYLRGDGSCQAPSGSGTVTSINGAGTGIFGFSGGPITDSGTLTLTVTGTSGGIPYFSASGTLSSSAALAAGQVVLGGGAGTTPATLAPGGTGDVLTYNGTAAVWTSPLDISDLGSSAGLSSGDLFLVYDLSDTESQQATAAQVQSFVLGNAFTTFTGPSSTVKTFTLPNASSTILTTNAAVTVAQGGTGATTLTGVLVGNGTSAFTAVTAPSGTIVGTSDTQTLTNKRVNPRVQTAADATSITPTSDSADMVIQTNTQSSGTLTVNAPTGTPVDGQKLVIRIKSTNSQTFSWNAAYRGSVDAALPTTHGGSSLTNYYGFVRNGADSTWDFVSKVAGF